ncbi:MAG TPA: hypothetical protein VM581_02480 [Magnetospirillaceae bacterium]|nr:hypothetical protein [Magnetospirillaceae bacterium]
MRVPKILIAALLLGLAGCASPIAPSPEQQSVISADTYRLATLDEAKANGFKDSGEVNTTRKLAPAPPKGTDAGQWFPDYQHNNELHKYVSDAAGVNGLELWANHASDPKLTMEVRAFRFTVNQGGGSKPMTYFCTGPFIKKDGGKLADFLKDWMKILPGLPSTAEEYQFVNQPAGERQNLCVLVK